MTIGRGLQGLGAVVVALVCTASVLQAQRIPFEKRFFAEQVLRPSEQPVVPIYEGYFENEDGTYDICFGYFNLNLDESVNVPLGENNFIEPAQYDGHQPTHFTPVPGMTPASPFTSRFRRIWCAFTVTVPADFGPEDVVNWTIQREDGPPVTTPGKVNIAYVLEEPASNGRGNLAPTLRFSDNGDAFQGRRGIEGPSLRARVGEPLELDLWVEHPFEEEVWVGWTQYQGEGSATFSPAEQVIEMSNMKGVTSTRVTFTEPGEYQLLVQAINEWPAFEFHCCWTNGYLSVTVSE